MTARRASRARIVLFLAALAVPVLLTGCSADDSGGVDKGSAEYQGGFKAADTEFAAMPDYATIGQKIGWCNNTLTITKAQAGFPLTQFPQNYSQEQRKSWARGCLDYLRMDTDVPAQAWEG